MSKSHPIFTECPFLTLFILVNKNRFLSKMKNFIVFSFEHRDRQNQKQYVHEKRQMLIFDKNQHAKMEDGQCEIRPKFGACKIVVGFSEKLSKSKSTFSEMLNEHRRTHFTPQHWLLSHMGKY